MRHITCTTIATNPHIEHTHIKNTCNSPASQLHVGHLNTNSSPAAMNSSGVSTPLERKADDLSVGVTYSRAVRSDDSSDGIIG